MPLPLPTDPNISTLTQTGLSIESNPDIVAFLVLCFQFIYGADINVDSNSPDGQLIGIMAQAVTDFLELLLATYNLAAIATSYGTRLDQLVALNGIQRKQGTFTQAQVLVTANAAVTVPGQDQTAITPFTVADNAGNQFQLVVSHVFGGPGAATLTFQAVNIGQVETTANTITNIITSTLGVSTVNNPSTASDTIGVNEETDAQLKVRQAQSFTLGATGPSDAMESALRNIPDVVDAIVIENNTAAPVNTVPAFTVWPIVNGGTNVEIAQAIYAKKSPGTPMKGSVSQLVTRPNGQTFLAQWDIAVAQPLHIAFSIIWRGPQVFSNDTLIAALAATLAYKLGQNPSIGDIVQAMIVIAPTAIVTINSATEGVSVDGSTWESLVSPNTAQNYFTVAPGNIAIL
jgi:hypothetical protein